MKVYHFTILLLIGLCAYLYSKEPAPKANQPDGAQVLVDRLLDRLRANDLTGLFAEYRKLSGATITIPETFERLQTRMTVERPLILAQLGKPNAVEFVRRQPAGESAVRYVYLEKLDKGILVWTFTLYKPRDEWVLFALNCTNDSNALFQ